MASLWRRRYGCANCTVGDGINGGGRVRSDDLGALVPVVGSTPQKLKGTRQGAFLSRGLDSNQRPSDLEPAAEACNLRICGSNPIQYASEAKKGTPVGCLLGNGGRIRTSDLRVMSSNPISYTVDRRSWVVRSPAHSEMVCRGYYLEGSPCQARSMGGEAP